MKEYTSFRTFAYSVIVLLFLLLIGVILFYSKDVIPKKVVLTWLQLFLSVMFFLAIGCVRDEPDHWLVLNLVLNICCTVSRRNRCEY